MWTCPNCSVELGARGGHLERCLNPYREIEAFNSKVQRGAESECWPFMGARVPAGGYGRARINQRLVAAHRIAYMLAYGEIPAGLDIMHLCDNPPCCNPQHLRAATTAENMADCKAKGRNTFGERNRRNKLTEDQAREVLAAKGNAKAADLAPNYGVKAGAILAIWRGDAWSHLQ